MIDRRPEKVGGVAATTAGRPGVGAGDPARSRPALERTAESVHLTNNQIVSGSPDELVCVPYGFLDYLLDVGFLVILWQEPVFKLVTFLFKFFRRLLHGVVPVAVKFVLDEGKLLHLTVGHLDPFLVYAVVEFGPDGSARFGSWSRRSGSPLPLGSPGHDRASSWRCG